MADAPLPTLILFTRIPVAGRAKTRLMPALPGEACAELQRAMVLDQVERLAVLGCPLTVCYADDGCDEAAVEAFCTAVRRSADRAPALRFARQRGEGLGARMASALADELAAGAAGAVLMGSDLPLVTPEVVERALAAFATADVLLCPSDDGGYWCIGVREYVPALFETGGYGGPTVFERTLAAVRKAGRTVAIGPVSRDIDTPDDLACLLALAHRRDPRVGSHVAAVLACVGKRAGHGQNCKDPSVAGVEGLPPVRAP